MLSALLGRRNEERAAHALYESVILQSRRPEFYARCGVPDTLDGRFDLIVLHAFLVLNRLGKERRASRLAQALFDLMFADMDSNLRELGASDLSVGKRVKAMAKAFYGRAAAYEAGLSGGADLGDALKRNLYRGAEAQPTQLEAMAAYLRAEAARVAEQSLDDLLAGRVRFGSPVLP